MLVVTIWSAAVVCVAGAVHNSGLFLWGEGVEEEEGRTEMIHIRAQRMPASSPVVLDQVVELERGHRNREVENGGGRCGQAVLKVGGR